MSKMVESQLKMLGLYFSKFDFNLDGPIDSTSLKNSITINHANKVDDKDEVRIQIDCTLEDEKGIFKLYLQTLGFFKLERNTEITDEIAEEILKKNTVAIMLPYIRSQISLLTTQPGMAPILLPPMDVNAMLDKGIEENTAQNEKDKKGE